MDRLFSPLLDTNSLEQNNLGELEEKQKALTSDGAAEMKYPSSVITAERKTKEIGEYAGRRNNPESDYQSDF